MFYYSLWPVLLISFFNFIFYIIGNGFDIAHGYDTIYSSFYIYLTNNKEKYPEILDVCNEINSNIEAWSDF